MTRVRSLKTDFSSGEVDPLMRSRSDTGAYRNGCAGLPNAYLYSTGAVGSRPGTEDCASLPAMARLEAFEFAPDERYLLAFSSGRLDVFNEDGTILRTAFTTGCSWSASNLFEMTIAHVADTMIVCHQDFWPVEILRTGLNTFVASDFAFSTSSNGDEVYQPFFKFADDDVTLSLSATTGTGVTATASHSIFQASHVGERLMWKGTQLEITGYTSATVVTVTVHGEAKGTLIENPFRVTQGSSVVRVSHPNHGFDSGESITFAGAGDTGGISAGNLNGARTITVLNDNEYEITAAASATESIDGGGPGITYTGANIATRDWLEQVFGDTNGYPAACGFHEGRLWFGGTGGVPDGLWSSWLFQFKRFDVNEGEANHSIQVRIGANDIAVVRHIVSNDDLQIFTEGGEFYLPAPRDQTITPANANIRRQGPFGANFVRPRVFDGATVFVQSRGNALREFIYNDVQGRYQSTNLNLLSQHLMQDALDMAVMFGSNDRSENYAVLSKGDGKCAVFHSARTENLAGWTPWYMGGEGEPFIHSIATVGPHLFFAVERDGSHRIARLSDNDSQSLDQATTYSGAASATWTLDSVYRGLTVAVRAGNYYLGEFPVAGDGTLTLDDEFTEITVGFPFEWKIESLPFDVEFSNGPTTGLPKRVARVAAQINSSLSVSISGTSLLLRQVRDDFSKEPEPLTGLYEFRTLGYSREAVVHVTRNAPMPVRVLGLWVELGF